MPGASSIRPASRSDSSGAEALLRARARRVLVDIATGRTIDSIYADGRLAVERAYRRRARSPRSRRSISASRVLDARLLDVHAPASVHDAFRDVASALEDRETEVHDANGYAAERHNEGEGESAAITEAARAEANRVARLADGTAGAFAGIARAHDAHPDLTERRLWLESLERALPAPRKFILAPAPSGGDVDLWVGGAAAPPPLVMPEPPPRGAPGARTDARHEDPASSCSSSPRPALRARERVVVVDETEHAVITQFGRPVAVLSDAGLHGKLPAPIQRVTRLDKRVLFTEQPADGAAHLRQEERRRLDVPVVAHRRSAELPDLAAHARGRGGAARRARAVGARRDARQPAASPVSCPRRPTAAVSSRSRRACRRPARTPRCATSASR